MLIETLFHHVISMAKRCPNHPGFTHCLDIGTCWQGASSFWIFQKVSIDCTSIKQIAYMPYEY